MGRTFSIRTMYLIAAFGAAILSGAYYLIKLREECGSVPLVACTMQALGLSERVTTAEPGADGGRSARQAAEQHKREREEAERRVRAAEKVREALDEEKRAAERARKLAEEKERAAADAGRAAEQYKREREEAERRAQAADNVRKAVEKEKSAAERARKLAEEKERVAALAVSPSRSFTAPIAEAASSWGLIGTWRLDCSKPVSRSNADLKYVVKGGELFHDREFGDTSDSNPVTSARAKSDGTIEIVVDFAGLSQTRRFSFMKAGDGRIRAMSNRNDKTNEPSVVDGKFTSNGQPTPWQTRCR